MPLIVTGISLPFEEPESYAVEAAQKLLGDQTVSKAYLVKKSIDARHRDNIRFVYSVGFELEEDEQAVADRLGHPSITAKTHQPIAMPKGSAQLTSRPVIVGFGPGGMFAALLLAQQGFRPVVLEQGDDMDTRIAQVQTFWSSGSLHEQSNVQFGEGGAGTFSDGKLVTRIGDNRCGYVLQSLVEHGAPPEILYRAKPHLGTDQLRGIVKSIRKEIQRLGGEVLFQTRLTGLDIRNGCLRGVTTSAGNFRADTVILAPGHSARNLFHALFEQGVPMLQKSFSVGVRIEHRQDAIDRALYGPYAGHPLLPKGEYQLSHREPGHAVYTFCMCPGGVVVPAASENGMVVTNGMSVYARDGDNANSALVVSVEPSDFGTNVLEGIELQRRLETAAYLAGGGGYKAPAQTVGCFLEDKAGLAFGQVSPSYARGVTGVNFADLFPDFVTNTLRTGLRRFGKKIAGFDHPDAVLTGIETRTSSPLRIPRNENLQCTTISGLYPCAEGAGYAGGIVSAAVDGIRCAQAVLSTFSAPA